MYRVKSSFERRVRERMGVLIELELVAYRLIHQSLDSSIYRASILEAWAWTSAGCAFVLSGRLSCYLDQERRPVGPGLDLGRGEVRAAPSRLQAVGSDGHVLGLARHWPDGGARRVEELAGEQGVPANYLVQILIELKAKHIVKSQRGKEGGYLLARPPSEISLGDVLRAVRLRSEFANFAKPDFTLNSNGKN